MSVTLTALRALGICEQEARRVTALATAAPVSAFIENNCYYAPGHLIAFAEFRAKFIASLPADQRWHWTKYRLSKALQVNGIVHGAYRQNKKYIANISWQPMPASTPFVIAPGNTTHGSARRLTTAINSRTNPRSRKPRATARTKTPRR